MFQSSKASAEKVQPQIPEFQRLEQCFQTVLPWVDRCFTFEAGLARLDVDWKDGQEETDANVKYMMAY